MPLDLTHATTVAQASLPRTKSGRKSRATGRPRTGRPIDPAIAQIELSVELIIAITDDAALMERAHHAQLVICKHRHDEMRRFGGPRLERLERIDAAEFRLTNALLARCGHLRRAVLPEAKRLYAVAEAHYAATAVERAA